jgi:hypothetical protein
MPGCGCGLYVRYARHLVHSPYIAREVQHARLLGLDNCWSRCDGRLLPHESECVKGSLGLSHVSSTCCVWGNLVLCCDELEVMDEGFWSEDSCAVWQTNPWLLWERICCEMFLEGKEVKILRGELGKGLLTTATVGDVNVMFHVQCNFYVSTVTCVVTYVVENASYMVNLRHLKFYRIECLSFAAFVNPQRN